MKGIPSGSEHFIRNICLCININWNTWACGKRKLISIETAFVEVCSICDAQVCQLRNVYNNKTLGNWHYLLHQFTLGNSESQSLKMFRFEVSIKKEEELLWIFAFDVNDCAHKTVGRKLNKEPLDNTVSSPSTRVVRSRNYR